MASALPMLKSILRLLKIMTEGCIIIPCFNEAENIVRVIDEASAACYAAEFVVINDASTDDTSRFARKTHKATVIDLSANLGVGGAFQTGLKYAKKNGKSWVVKLDGDGQHPPAAVNELLELIMNGQADIVVGSRFLTDNDGFRSTFLRRIGIRFFEWLCLLLTGRTFTDPTSGFRAYNKRAIDFMAQDYPTFDYPEPEELVLASKFGLIVKEVPVLMRARWSGESTISSTISVYYMLKVTLAMIFIYLRKADGTMKSEAPGCSME